jgi:hypothetical protein
MNNQTIKKWALYYKNSIKDVNITKIYSKPNEIKQLYDKGYICPLSDIYQSYKISNLETVNLLFKKYKDLVKTDTQPEKSIPIVIIPHIARKKTINRASQDNNDNFPAYILPLWIPADLSIDGVLSYPDDDRLPFINRNYLSPNSNDMVIIDTISNIDKIIDDNLATVSDKEKLTWTKWLEFSEKLLCKDWEDVIKSFFNDEYKINNSNVIIIPDDSDSNMTRNIIAVYNDIIDDNNNISELFEKYCDESENKSIDFLDIDKQILITKKYHTGHIASYQLAASQRESLIHSLNLKDGGIMAINGPPGTGKTTLLHSLWASLWINSALEKKQIPPIIVASSTNNQAILNILDSLEKDIDIKRWLPKPLQRLGIFLASQSKETESIEKKCHVYKKGEGVYKKGEGIFNKIETQEYLDKAKNYYKQNFNKTVLKTYNNIEAITDVIYNDMILIFNSMQEIIDTAISYKAILNKYGDNVSNIEIYKNKIIQEINTITQKKTEIDDEIENYKNIKIKWNQYLSKEPIIYSLLKWFLKDKIKAKDETFFSDNNIKIPINVNRKTIKDYFDNQISLLIYSELYVDLKNKLTNNNVIYDKIKQDINKINALENKFNYLLENNIWNKITNNKPDITKINDFSDNSNPVVYLDTTARYILFTKAVHYWEGRYLIELEKQLNNRIARNKDYDKRTKEGQTAMWRRYAMATPLFITTLHTGPGMFTYYDHVSAILNKKHYGLIDLLIIDESGQVSTEIAGSMFAFAKKAVVVGDTRQLQPVDNLPAYIDASNAVSAGIALNKQDYINKKDKNIFIHNNSVMLKAHKKVGYKNDKYDEPGMFLSEHRRCFDPIINYCNELVYNNKIIALKGTGESLYPYMGYAHISGECKKMGGSRYNMIEADSIIEWLYNEKDKILKYYNKQHLSECVGIVTPFKAQEFALKKALKTKGLLLDSENKDNWKCGTVHSLQGAEKEIIIFSPVYTYTDKNNSFFFDKTKDMLNVAVSRAKCSFLVFGDMSIMDSKKKHLPSGLLSSYIFADSSNEIIIETIRQNLINTIDPNQIEHYNTVEAHRKILSDSFNMAQNRLIIVSPYISDNALKADGIYDKISETLKKKIAIDIFADKSWITDKKRESYIKPAIDLLNEIGIKVKLINNLHAKLLIVDNNILIEGSFNWLSARRVNDFYKQQFDASIMYSGDKVESLIESNIVMLKALE